MDLASNGAFQSLNITFNITPDSRQEEFFPIKVSIHSDFFGCAQCIHSSPFVDRRWYLYSFLINEPHYPEEMRCEISSHGVWDFTGQCLECSDAGNARR